MASWTRKKTQDELDILNKHTRWMRWGVYLLILYVIFSDMLANTINSQNQVVDYTSATSEVKKEAKKVSADTDKVISKKEEITKNISPTYSKIVEGTGNSAICGDAANISYKIILYDGTIFLENNASIVIGSGSNNLFEQSIDGMKVNGIRQIVFPPEYADKFAIKDNGDKKIAVIIELKSLENSKINANKSNCEIRSYWKENIF